MLHNCFVCVCVCVCAFMFVWYMRCYMQTVSKNLKCTCSVIWQFSFPSFWVLYCYRTIIYKIYFCGCVFVATFKYVATLCVVWCFMNRRITNYAQYTRVFLSKIYFFCGGHYIMDIISYRIFCMFCLIFLYFSVYVICVYICMYYAYVYHSLVSKVL